MVVFVADARNGAPRDAEGRPFLTLEGPGSPSVALCENLAEAEQFATCIAARRPELRCEIYDHEGRSSPPVAVVYDPSVRDRYIGMGHARRQFLIGLAFAIVGITLAAIDLLHRMTFIWGYVVGLKCVILGGTFLTRGVLEWLDLRKSELRA